MSGPDSGHNDPGQIEVVSEQQLDGSYEIKVQTRETPAADPPERVRTSGEAAAPEEGSAAAMLGFGAVLILLAVGSWFLFVSPQADEDAPLVTPGGTVAPIPSTVLPESTTPTLITPPPNVQEANLQFALPNPDAGIQGDDAASAATAVQGDDSLLLEEEEQEAVYADDEPPVEEVEEEEERNPVINSRITPPNRVVDPALRANRQNLVPQVDGPHVGRPGEAFDELDDDWPEEGDDEDDEYEYDDEYDDEDDEYDDEDDEYDDDEYYD